MSGLTQHQYIVRATTGGLNPKKRYMYKLCVSPVCMNASAIAKRRPVGSLWLHQEGDRSRRAVAARTCVLPNF
ncbi:hypothetical protein [Coleofasciculus sp. H7-2]|uniref:hypothetical protein n=1 Tax=Coleofasciculus sp. H7-2 TaxID=3351545 RepID=UPI003672B5FF